MRIMRNKFIRTIAISVSMYSTHAVSGDLGIDLFSETEYSSNITRSRVGGLSDVEQRSGLIVNYLEESRSVQADANFRLETLNYLENTYEDEVSLTTGFGVVNFNLVEDLLSWQTSYDREELLVGVGAEDTPDNREYRGVLRTGPVVDYRFSPSSSVSLNSRYVKAQNTGDFLSDSERFESDLSYIYQWNSITELIVISGYEDLFEIESESTYKRYSMDVGASRLVSNGLISLTVGRTYLEPKFGDSLSENHIDLEFRRDRFLLHDLTLRYSQNLFDNSVGSPVTDASESVTAEALEDSTSVREEFYVVVERDLGGARYTISPYWFSEKYANALIDEDNFGASFRYDFEVNTFLQTGFMASYDQTDYGNGLANSRFGVDETYTFEVSAIYSVSATLTLNTTLQYENQTNKYVLDREYDEISAGLGLNWQLFE